MTAFFIGSDSMKMTLYHTDDQANVVNKNLLKLREVNIILREMVDEKSPVLLVHDSTIANANYCYLESFKRYYFIDQVRRFNAHLLQARLTNDLLMTYKDKIVGQDLLITATSQPSYYSAGLPTTQHIELDRYTSDFTLPEGKTTILTTIGG